MDLYNETAVNVATLLREPVGATRVYQIELERVDLDGDFVARTVSGELRLTRLTDEILADVHVAAEIELVCLRCLEVYTQEVNLDFQEEFRVAFDVRTGHNTDTTVDDERPEISDTHELDISEPLRQELIIALPMRPSCGDACRGPSSVGQSEREEGDERFAVLAKLLGGNSDKEK
jgi:uncharacterized protein